MAGNDNNTSPVNKFVKGFDLTHVLPQNSPNKKYLLLLGGPEMHTVQDAVKKLQKLFDLQNIVLTSGDAAVPELENVQILLYLDDVQVKRKSGTGNPQNRSNPNKNMSMNNLSYFLNVVRTEATASEISDTSAREVSDAPVKGNSSSSDVAEKEDAGDFLAPAPKRKRIRKHRKRSQKASPGFDDQNGTETVEQIAEVEEPAVHALSAIYSLKDTYGTAPIFKKE